MSDDIIRTAFDRVQRELGGELMDWEGWYWPNHFGDPVAEHHAVRNDVGVWDASPLRKWRFVGPDAAAAADRIFTGDILALEPGQVRYAPFCDESGKMVGDGTVFMNASDRCLVVTALDSDLEHFESVVGGMDVSIEPKTADYPHIGLNGPRSRELLSSICDADVAGLRYFRFFQEPVEVGGVPCWVSRTGYSGELGYEIFTGAEHAEQLWAAVTGAGAQPYGLAAVETLRIESGLIFIGYDYFQHETSPFEMSLDKVIRLDRGDFCGKAALTEEAKNPPSCLTTVEIPGGEVPEYGAAVFQGGEKVGTLTSPCESPTLGKVIGLTVLPRSLARKGIEVEIAAGEGTARAKVADFPIYDPEKTRPRA